MSQMMRYEFRLFDGRKGGTCKINGHQFTDGICHLNLTVTNAAALMRVLGYYGAYAKGTPEYDAALAKEQEEEARGANEVHEGSKRRGAAKVQGNVQPNGSGPSEAPADAGEGATGSEARDSGADSSGSGHGHAGVPKFEEAATRPEPSEPPSVADDAVAAAIRKLDPENDDHWVQTGARKGKPKLSAVEEAYGRAGLTIQDLESALPGWTRDKAMEDALAA